MTVGLDAHPHMLRHALASTMAANKEPASIMAAQLRHTDGGALAQRVHIHHSRRPHPGLPDSSRTPSAGQPGKNDQGRHRVERMEPTLAGQHDSPERRVGPDQLA
jgi:hypothetical protein